MPRGTCCLGAVLVAALGTLAVPGASAQGRSPRPTALVFPPPSGVDFPAAGGLALPADGFGFPAGDEIRFPTSLDRTETASEVQVVLPADVLFDFDRADIRPAAAETLREVAALIRDKARGPVAVTGHTDALGADAYNQRLSERRAAAVKAWLATREGLGGTRFTTAGQAARDPVAPNRRPDGSDDPEGRQLNRRVVLTIRR